MGGAKHRQSLARMTDANPHCDQRLVSIAVVFSIHGSAVTIHTLPDMARSPLFQEVQRALRLASWLERTGTTTTEALERREEVKWNRRRFLKTAVAAAA